MASHRHRLLRNPTDGRLRAPWRVLIPFVLVLAGITAGDLLFVAPLQDSPWGYLLGGVTRVLLGVGVVAATARLLDRRRLRAYGLRGDPGWWVDATVGAAIGMAIFGLSTFVAIAAGWVQVQEVLSPAATGGLWAVLALALFRLAAVSLWEELIFRGVMIKNVAEGLGQRWSTTRAVLAATAIATPIFAVIHVPQNLGAGVPMAQMMAMWLSLGGLLACGYVLTGQLALPLGLHLTVNLALQHVFVLWGERAAQAPTILQLEVVGEGSLAGVGGWLQLGAVALGYVLLFAWVRWRHGALRVHPSLAVPPQEAVARRRGADPEASRREDRATDADRRTDALA